MVETQRLGQKQSEKTDARIVEFGSPSSDRTRFNRITSARYHHCHIYASSFRKREIPGHLNDLNVPQRLLIFRALETHMNLSGYKFHTTQIHSVRSDIHFLAKEVVQNLITPLYYEESTQIMPEYTVNPNPGDSKAIWNSSASHLSQGIVQPPAMQPSTYQEFVLSFGMLNYVPYLSIC
jgi:hypothetical protein